jgi:hypothetical protein
LELFGFVDGRFIVDTEFGDDIRERLSGEMIMVDSEMRD